jgi:hypothetical protein
MDRNMIEETYELITPQQAKDYLALNTNNWRTLKKQRVASLASDMAGGRWVLHTGTIDFTEDGKLGDGQHRLAAIVESGATIMFRVRRNVPMDVIENIDSGPRRTFGELLAHRGETNANALAATIAMAYLWEHGGAGAAGRSYPTTPTLMAWFTANPEIAPFANTGRQIGREIHMKGRVIGAALYEFAKIDPTESAVFGQRLRDGVGLGEHDAILALRNQATKVKKSRFSTDGWYDLGLTVKAWNSWITGTPVKLLVYRRGGSVKEGFPQPVNGQGVVYPVWTETTD